MAGTGEGDAAYVGTGIEEQPCVLLRAELIVKAPQHEDRIAELAKAQQWILDNVFRGLRDDSDED